MTGDKQADANRRNALKSTGPKTPKGKDAVRLNALKHGLLSQEVLLPGEDEAVLKELGERVRTELQPAGELEDLFVEQILAAIWRLRRLRRVEAGIFAWEHFDVLAEQVREEARIYERGQQLTQRLEQVSTTEADRQKRQEVLSKAEEMKAQQDTETATLGRTFIRDPNEANAFSKLSRYETAIEWGLYRALHELQHLQAARRVEVASHRPRSWTWMCLGSPGKTCEEMALFRKNTPGCRESRAPLSRQLILSTVTW
jgi:hypothetical protein